MGILDSVTGLFTNPQQAVQDVASDVTSGVANTGRGFLGGIFGGLSGFAKGAFNLWNIVKYSALSLGLQTLGAPLYDAAYGAIFGKEALHKLAQEREKGLANILLTSVEQGFAANAVIGGTSGAIEGAGGGIGGTLGVGLVMATVAAVGLGALHKGDIKAADNHDHTTPTPVPGAKPKAEKAKGN